MNVFILIGLASGTILAANIILILSVLIFTPAAPTWMAYPIPFLMIGMLMAIVGMFLEEMRR